MKVFKTIVFWICIAALFVVLGDYIVQAFFKGIVKREIIISLISSAGFMMILFIALVADPPKTLHKILAIIMAFSAIEFCLSLGLSMIFYMLARPAMFMLFCASILILAMLDSMI